MAIPDLQVGSQTNKGYRYKGSSLSSTSAGTILKPPKQNGKNISISGTLKAIAAGVPQTLTNAQANKLEKAGAFTGGGGQGSVQRGGGQGGRTIWYRMLWLPFFEWDTGYACRAGGTAGRVSPSGGGDDLLHGVPKQSGHYQCLGRAE